MISQRRALDGRAGIVHFRSGDGASVDELLGRDLDRLTDSVRDVRQLDREHARIGRQHETRGRVRRQQLRDDPPCRGRSLRPTISRSSSSTLTVGGRGTTRPSAQRRAR